MGTRRDVASRRSAPSGHVATTTLQRGPFSRCHKVPFLLAISSGGSSRAPPPACRGATRGEADGRLSGEGFPASPGDLQVLVPVAVDSPRRYTGAMNAIDERACGKPGCDNFGKPGLNIVGHGWFVTTSGRRRRYRCTVCGGTLSTNTGTAYRGLRCSRREFDQVATYESRASAFLRPPE